MTHASIGAPEKLDLDHELLSPKRVLTRGEEASGGRILSGRVVASFEHGGGGTVVLYVLAVVVELAARRGFRTWPRVMLALRTSTGIRTLTVRQDLVRDVADALREAADVAETLTADEE